MKNILLIIIFFQCGYLLSQENPKAVFNKYLLASLSDNDKRGVTFALKNGASVHAVDKVTGNTALMLAAKSGNQAWVNYFLEHGVNINAQNKLKQTALMIAVNYGFLKIVRMLVDLPHCNVHIRNQQNMSAIDIACDLHSKSTNKLKKIYSEIAQEILRYQAKL